MDRIGLDDNMANPIVIGLDVDSSIGCQFLLQQLQGLLYLMCLEQPVQWHTRDIKRTISRRGLETKGVFQPFYLFFYLNKAGFQF